MSKPVKPAASEERQHKVTVRVTREELSQFRALAAIYRRTLSDTIREAVTRELGRKS